MPFPTQAPGSRRAGSHRAARRFFCLLYELAGVAMVTGLFAFLLAVLAGCSVTVLESDSFSLTSMRVGIDTGIEAGKMSQSAEGLSVEIGGYNANAKVEALKAIIESLP